VLARNTAQRSEISHSIAHVLTTLVIPESLELSLALVLCKGLEAFKGLEDVRLGSNGGHKAISRVVIDECDPVAIAREGPIGQHVYISVHEFQRTRSVPLRARERIGMHLASQAWLTDRMRRSPEVQLHPSDHVTLVERLDPLQMMVSKPAMPKGQIQGQS